MTDLLERLDETRALLARRNYWCMAQAEALLWLDVIAAAEKRRAAYQRMLACFAAGDYSHGGYEARDDLAAASADVDAALTALADHLTRESGRGA